MKVVSAILVLISQVAAQNESVHVISYHAAGNSIVNQPYAGIQNVLRFYPIYTMRDSVKSAVMTVYYGSKICTRKAVRFGPENYWQALLPTFELGEAIHRIEIEVEVALDKRTIDQYDSLVSTINREAKQLLDQTKSALKVALDSVDSGAVRMKNTMDTFRQLIDNYQTELKSRGYFIDSSNWDSLKDIEQDMVRYKKLLDGAKASLEILQKDASADTLTVDRLKDTLKKHLDDSTSAFKKSIPAFQSMEDKKVASEILNRIKEEIRKTQDTLKAYRSNLDALIKKSVEIASKALSDRILVETRFVDSLRTNLAKSTRDQFIDKSENPTITKDDIKLSVDSRTAFILFRNHKISLRKLPALDPAEDIGIFRARYVPFPVVGKKLLRPFQANSIACFEIGLAFGDKITPGDDFVKPVLSVRRFGFAFAITNEFFTDQAQIIALALTYDFNSFGSVGLGVNFADPKGRERATSYFSFGVNKKAFEMVISQANQLFR